MTRLPCGPVSYDAERLARDRGSSYGFFSVLCFQPPDSVLLSKFIQGREVPSTLAFQGARRGLQAEMNAGIRLFKGFIEASRRSSTSEFRDSLAADFTKLFRGVSRSYGPPPPYESVYMEESGLVMGSSTLDVIERYRAAGLCIRDCFRSEPPDHIAFELDFMRALCEEEAEAWQGKGEEEALPLVRLEKEFLTLHLTRWIPRFCDRVVGEAGTAFYKGLAMTVKAFVILDHTYIISLLDMFQEGYDVPSALLSNDEPSWKEA